MAQASNTSPSDLIVRHDGIWKVYTKTNILDEWLEDEDLYVISVNQSIGRSTGTATLKYLTQDANRQKNMKIEGWQHHRLSMTGTTMPTATLIKIQSEQPPPAEGESETEPEVIFIGIILSMTLDFSGDLIAQDLTAIDIAGMMNNYDFFGKRSLNLSDTATVFYNMLPVFNPGDRGNRSIAEHDGAYVFDESGIEDTSTDGFKWNSNDIINYLMWWLNNSAYFGAPYYDYQFYREFLANQSSLAYDDDTIRTNYEAALETNVGSPPSRSIGGSINNWIPYNKGCWNAMVDLVEMVGQFTLGLRYFGDGTAQITVVAR